MYVPAWKCAAGETKLTINVLFMFFKYMFFKNRPKNHPPRSKQFQKIYIRVIGVVYLDRYGTDRVNKEKIIYSYFIHLPT